MHTVLFIHICVYDIQCILYIYIHSKYAAHILPNPEAKFLVCCFSLNHFNICDSIAKFTRFLYNINAIKYLRI